MGILLRKAFSVKIHQQTLSLLSTPAMGHALNFRQCLERRVFPIRTIESILYAPQITLMLIVPQPLKNNPICDAKGLLGDKGKKTKNSVMVPQHKATYQGYNIMNFVL